MLLVLKLLTGGDGPDNEPEKAVVEELSDIRWLYRESGGGWPTKGEAVSLGNSKGISSLKSSIGKAQISLSSIGGESN